MLQQAEGLRQKRGDAAGPQNAPRLALVLVGIGELIGSGGAERTFSDLHEYLASHPGSIDVSLITDRTSLERLRAAGRLAGDRGLIVLSLGRAPARGKVKTAWMTARLLWTILVARFDLVHVCLPTPNFVPLFAVLSRLPAVLRPKLTLSVIDCTLAASFEAPPPTGSYEGQVLDAHRLYFRWASLDGVFSWYRAFCDLAARRPLVQGAPVLRAARFCFTDPARFRPTDQKERLVVFAGRLSLQKRPLLFVEAVATLMERAPDLVRGWRFEMYGKGVLEPELRRRITELGFDGVVTLTHAIDMAPVFARSKLFVSTQAVENFTSLSMLEAMAAGNAIIAAAVGQTDEFVHDGENGILAREESAAAFAAAMAEYLGHPDRHAAMAEHSRQLATEVHTVERFADDLVGFWQTVLDAPAAGEVV